MPALSNLARKRGEHFHLSEKDKTRLERFPQDCREEVARTSPNKYKDRGTRFLVTKKSFQYLVSVLVDDSNKKWYLVSVAPWKAKTVQLEFV